MTFTGQETYVKENYMLYRQQATEFIQLSIDVNNRMPKPEMMFMGKGTRIHLNPPSSGLNGGAMQPTRVLSTGDHVWHAN